MKLELISFSRCPYVHRAATMLHEKRIEFSVRYIDLQNKPDWFLKISPRGKVPVLVYDGAPIFESTAINELLDETNPPRMLPDDPIERARQRGWVEVANDLLQAQYDFAGAVSEEDFRKAEAKLRAVVERFEETIRGPYFAGEDFGWVDVASAPYHLRQTLLNAVFQDLPKTRAWTERVAKRDSVVRGVKEDFADEYLGRVQKRGAFVLSARARAPARP